MIRYVATVRPTFGGHEPKTLPMKVTPQPGGGFYATSPGLGCGKDELDPEGAILGLLRDHGLRLLQLIEAKGQPEPFLVNIEMALGATTVWLETEAEARAFAEADAALGRGWEYNISRGGEEIATYYANLRHWNC